jgi:hypothetical protein
MININSVRAVVLDIEEKTFGFNFEFSLGLNILTGDNTSGKSSVLACIYYCLGLEQLIAFGNGNGMKECLTSVFSYRGNEHNVLSSQAILTLSNESGKSATISRIIRGAYSEDTNLLTVTMMDGAPEDKFIHQNGDTDHEDGFYKWLGEFSGIEVPTFTDIENKKTTILYLQQIFASSFVEQTKGWSDFFAQVPSFSTKKAKQKIVEFVLGLNGLIEEFELDKLKDKEKEYKYQWNNKVQTFRSISSYYNFLPANLDENFTADMSPAKINKVVLHTRDFDQSFHTLDEEVTGINRQIEAISAKNEIDIPIKGISKDITDKHLELKNALQSLNQEYKTIIAEKVNEEIKRKKYLEIVSQLAKEIETLEGINKLSGLKSFKVGSVENCPVCNSSLLNHSDFELKNVEVIGNVKSLAFSKSEIKLYKSYLENSNDLIERFSKTAAYYQDRVEETKGMLDILDREILEDSRIPSRANISFEIRLKFRHEQLLKVQDLFTEFKSHLTQIALEMAKIRARKKIISDHGKSDEDLIHAFKIVFKSYLKEFGYAKEIIERVYISQEDSNKLFPVVSVDYLPQAQPIRQMSSASDFIRALWSFYLALLAKSKNHLGILLLDEPGQHAMKSVDLQSLLKVSSLFKTKQIIIAISKEDKIKHNENDPNEKDPEVEVNLLKLLDESGLKIDEDYRLNMIENHGMGDKSVQPFDPNVRNTRTSEELEF